MRNIEEMFEIELQGKKFYYIDNYPFSFGTVYQFENLKNRIFCEKIGKHYQEIKDKKKLKEIIERVDNADTDIL